MSHYQFRSRT